MAPLPRSPNFLATPLQPHHVLASVSGPHARKLPSSWSIISVRNLTTKISSLIRRQTQVLPIPATYAGLNAGPDPGIVVGITLGSVAAFLLILWLLYTCFGQAGGGGQVVQEEVIRRRSRSPRRRSVVSRSETIEIASPPRRERTPPRREPARRETIVIEETLRRDDEDDIVEVIEEHSPPPRRNRSSRNSGGGYRPVEPNRYAGGDEPFRKVSSRR